MASAMDLIFIVGLATAYPSQSLNPDGFEELLTRLYPDRITEPGLQKLIHFNRKTNIQSRPTIIDHSTLNKADRMAPSPKELSSIYLNDGVALSAQACREAMLEARVFNSEITHVVAVTCTDQSNPGYDFSVCQKLDLRPDVDRVLLHGVGCAGGLSALRTAANLAAAASSRDQPARILVLACELCSLFSRAEFEACLNDGELHIAPALFSDAAAAVVVCNGFARRQDTKPIFQLLRCGSAVIPGTSEQMSYNVGNTGMIARITKEVPKTVVSAIRPMFSRLRNSPNNMPHLFDWAIHPGGSAILHSAKECLQLTDDHIRASLGVYSDHGNSSSPTVLIVLERLRRMGYGRDHIVATSFGPGIAIEMCMLRRCRSMERTTPTECVPSSRREMFCAKLHARIAKVIKVSRI